MQSPYQLVDALLDEVKSTLVLHPLVSSLINLFLKYLKEPRYQSPLTIKELSSLFQYFYKDLKSLAIASFAQSNSTKKQLIASCATFNKNPKIFDYLLAISNYSSSSIKLSKRTDKDALYQLRVFNYYKFLYIFETIELAQMKLFKSINNGEENSLYDKVFRFDQKDIIFQEFLEEKLDLLRDLNLPFRYFIEEKDVKELNPEISISIPPIHPSDDVFDPPNDLSDTSSDPPIDFTVPSDNRVSPDQLSPDQLSTDQSSTHFASTDSTTTNPHSTSTSTSTHPSQSSSSTTDKLIYFMDTLPNKDIQIMDSYLNDLSTKNITPYSKLMSIIKVHKYFISCLIKHGFKNSEINNDLLLPSLIYLFIYKLDFKNDLYLNFLFIQNFINLIDSYNVETYNMNLYSSYTPTDRSKVVGNKYKQFNLYDLLNLNERQGEEEEEVEVDEEFRFFKNDSLLIDYLLKNYLNSGEVSYYLTNFEAIVVFLSNITLPEILTHDIHLFDDHRFENQLLRSPISKLVDDELLSHFQFPDGELNQEIQVKEETGRSRSSSLLNTINRITDIRSRSNSSVINSLKSSNISLSKENFPTLSSSEMDTHSDENNISISIMKNIIGRLSSVLVPQFRNPNDEETHDESTITSVFTSPQRKSSLMNKLSPNHSRTRSSSLENGQLNHASKRNSITSKLSNGVSEFMTKLNSNPPPLNPPPLNPNDKNVSNASLQTLENENESTTTVQGSRRPDYSRSRTTSLQIMDKWFNNISANHQTKSHLATTEEDHDLTQLTKYQAMDFEQLSISDLREMKSYYDSLCNMVTATSEVSSEQISAEIN